MLIFTIRNINYWSSSECHLCSFTPPLSLQVSGMFKGWFLKLMLCNLLTSWSGLHTGLWHIALQTYGNKIELNKVGISAITKINKKHLYVVPRVVWIHVHLTQTASDPVAAHCRPGCVKATYNLLIITVVVSHSLKLHLSLILVICLLLFGNNK